MCVNIPAVIEKYKDVKNFGLKRDINKMEIRGFTVQYLREELDQKKKKNEKSN